MEISFEKDLNSNLHVKAVGKLDIDTAAEYGMKINDAIDDYSGTKDLFLDFSQITYVASIGLRVLLELYQNVSKQGGSVNIINVQAPVAEVLKMTGFDKFLKVS